MTQRERIIEQTMQMFVTQGIKSVRMDDIAQQLGVSKRTLYEQFGDKEGLLYLAMAHYFEMSGKHWAELSAKAENVLEALFITLGDVMNRAEMTTRMMNNLKKFYPAVYDRLSKEGNEKHRAEFRVMLERGIDEGLFIGNINIDLAISVLYHTSASIVTPPQGLILPEGVSESEAFVQIISTFFRGIATPKGLLLIDEYRTRYEPEKDEK